MKMGYKMLFECRQSSAYPPSTDDAAFQGRPEFSLQQLRVSISYFLGTEDAYLSQLASAYTWLGLHDKGTVGAWHVDSPPSAPRSLIPSCPGAHGNETDLLPGALPGGKSSSAHLL